MIKNRQGLNKFLKKHRSAHFTIHDAHYFMQLAKDFKAKSKTIHCSHVTYRRQVSITETI